MVSESFTSPNAIPPRTSSTGLNGTFDRTSKSVLKPVPEGSWIGQSKLLSTTTSHTGPPGHNPPSHIGNEALHGDGHSWSVEKEKILLGPYDYMFDQPGKDIRKQLIAAFNAWLKVPDESLAIITKVVGMLHTASLLLVIPSIMVLVRQLTIPQIVLTMLKTPRCSVAGFRWLTVYSERPRR